jgi:uncharacterized protein with GYD domain
MPKYLLTATYTTDGIKGLLKDGGSKRRAAARTLVESLGGKFESFYFTFGETDAIVIADFPDPTTAAAASLTIAGSGAVRGKVTVLLSAEEIDQAVRKTGSYTPPGH